MNCLPSTVLVSLLAMLATDGGVCMPTGAGTDNSATGTTETTLTPTCEWHTDIPVSKLTSLTGFLNLTKIKAELAFNSTCPRVTSNNAAMCSFLEESARTEQSYPSFSQQASDSCSVQELVEAAYNVTYESLRLTRQFLEDIAGYYGTDSDPAVDITTLKNTLRSVNAKLLAMVPNLQPPSPVSTLVTGTSLARQLNVRLMARIAMEVHNISTAFSLAISHL